MKQLHLGLSPLPAYVGFIPATFQTEGKTYLSITLANHCLKYRDQIIMAHEDDRSNEEDVNMLGYPFADWGYRIRSLQSTHFGVFLSYKVERATWPGELDTSLNAVSRNLVPLEHCSVRIDGAKHEYLMNEKRGLLNKAGLAHLDHHELAAAIKNKISANYVYNLTFLEDHAVVKFNLMVEVPRHDGGHPTRLVAPGRRTARATLVRDGEVILEKATPAIIRVRVHLPDGEQVKLGASLLWLGSREETVSEESASQDPRNLAGPPEPVADDGTVSLPASDPGLYRVGVWLMDLRDEETLMVPLDGRSQPITVDARGETLGAEIVVDRRAIDAARSALADAGD